VQKLQSAKEVWEALCSKHEKKALTIIVDIIHCIHKLKCNFERTSHKCTYLETLMKMQEQVTGMGVGLPDTDLVTVILRSLLKLYQPLINAISMSSTQAKASLMPNKVIKRLDEFE